MTPQVPAASAVLEATIDEVDRLNNDITEAEDQLRRLKERRKFLAEHLMVELVTNEQLNSGAQLKDGTVVDFEREFYLNILKSERPKALDWVAANGGAQAIRHSIVVAFPAGREADAEVFMRMASMIAGVEVDVDSQLHGATMRKFVKEKFFTGIDVPECIGVYAPLVVRPRMS